MLLASRVEAASKLPIFPPWFDLLVKVLGPVGAIGGLHALAVVYLGFSPLTIDVGYEPKQPVPYSHRLHAGELGMDCRYCHNTVEVSSQASIPPTATCMNCHTMVRTTSPLLEPVRQSHETGDPVQWVRVHDLSDFAYFNHSAHVTRGIGCASCHDRIDRMDEVYQAQKLSMGWCLDCHRNPEAHLRPKDQITNMGWKASDFGASLQDPSKPMTQKELGKLLRAEYQINPSTSCSICHR